MVFSARSFGDAVTFVQVDNEGDVDMDQIVRYKIFALLKQFHAIFGHLHGRVGGMPMPTTFLLCLCAVEVPLASGSGIPSLSNCSRA